MYSYNEIKNIITSCAKKLGHKLDGLYARTIDKYYGVVSYQFKCEICQAIIAMDVSPFDDMSYIYIDNPTQGWDLDRGTNVADIEQNKLDKLRPAIYCPRYRALL